MEKREGWNHLIFIPIDVLGNGLDGFFIPCNLIFMEAIISIILPGDRITIVHIAIHHHKGHNDLSRIVCDVIIIIPFSVYILWTAVKKAIFQRLQVFRKLCFRVRTACFRIMVAIDEAPWNVERLHKLPKGSEGPHIFILTGDIAGDYDDIRARGLNHLGDRAKSLLIFFCIVQNVHIRNLQHFARCILPTGLVGKNASKYHATGNR